MMREESATKLAFRMRHLGAHSPPGLHAWKRRSARARDELVVELEESRARRVRGSGGEERRARLEREGGGELARAIDSARAAGADGGLAGERPALVRGRAREELETARDGGIARAGEEHRDRERALVEVLERDLARAGVEVEHVVE